MLKERTDKGTDVHTDEWANKASKQGMSRENAVGKVLGWK